jgi:signal transduction histidine kinase
MAAGSHALVTAAGCAAFGGMSHGVSGRGGADQAEAVMLESSLAIIGAWLIGNSVRQQRAITASRRAQAEQLTRQQLAEARRAHSEEPLRIARELHDVVAHSLTLIAVQAGVANHVATRQPEQAARALSSIETISRGALTEMRALLGVLRADDLGEVRPQHKTPACSPPWASPICGISRSGPPRPASVLTWTWPITCRISRPAWISPCSGSSRRRSPTWSKHAAADHCQVRLTR